MISMPLPACQRWLQAQLAGDHGAKGGGGGRHNHPRQPQLGFEGMGIGLQGGDLGVQVGQLGFKKILNFGNLLHDPFLVGFNRHDPLVQAVDVGR